MCFAPKIEYVILPHFAWLGRTSFQGSGERPIFNLKKKPVSHFGYTQSHLFDEKQVNRPSPWKEGGVGQGGKWGMDLVLGKQFWVCNKPCFYQPLQLFHEGDHCMQWMIACPDESVPGLCLPMGGWGGVKQPKIHPPVLFLHFDKNTKVSMVENKDQMVQSWAQNYGI